MQIFEYNPPSDPWLDVRFEDDDVVIINKPSGLLSNPGRAKNTYDCALTRLEKQFRDIILVHRLDCSTSGVMVFAKNKQVEIDLKVQFQNRETKKVYIAQVQGHLAKKEGCINLPLAKDSDNVPKQKVCHKQGKSAVTYYRVIEERSDSTLVELKPVTGRTHQLRVHMLAIGHPILGDDFYGDAACIAASPRLNLHAQSLSFTHPTHKELVSFSVPHEF
ncbi:Similar to ribosomal large subunit pseudouridine synthase A, group 2 [Pseudoalteromonas luteoviolacea B = ATCC 29581]|nr:Similar to ribosomal large subunit pseudouridine synthase A, group 2 [Pseudoalteromonas luteoviolacea B = ATCC 29581]